MQRLKTKFQPIRDSSVFKYGLTNLLPRSVAILITLVITPLAIHRLGVVEYGLWALATLIPNLISSPDFGITYGVVNEMSRINVERGNLRSQRERLLGLSRLLSLIAIGWLLLGVIGLAWYAFGIARNTDVSPNYTFAVLFLALGIFVLGISPSLWGRVQLAQERGHEYLKWEGIGKTVSFVASFLTLLLFPNLYLLIITSLLPNVIASYINARIYIREGLGPPTESHWAIRKTIEENRAIFAAGKYFFVFQLTFLIGSAVDPFIVNALLRTQDVAYLTLARRPFDVLPLAVTLFSTALWPVFYKLNSSNQLLALKRLLIRITSGSLSLLILLSIVIISFHGPIYNYLSQGKIQIHRTDLIWIAFQTMCLTIILVFNNYMSAMNLLRSQMWVQIIASGLGVVAKFIALKYGGLSAYFPVASLIYFVFAFLPMGWLTVTHIQHRTRTTV